MKQVRFAIALLAGLWVSGCFPERFPVAPENYENRRPRVAYVQPEDGRRDVRFSDTVKIWFDEKMDAQSVRDFTTLELVKTLDDESNDEWNVIDSIASFAASVSSAQTMFVGLGEKGAMRSENGGERWSFLRALSSERILRAAYHPQNPAAMLVATASRKILRASDGGASWTQATGLPSDTLIQITALQFDPAEPQNVWLGVQRLLPNGLPDNAYRNGVWKSVDGGASWQETFAQLPNWDSRFAISGISVNPTASNVVFISTRGRAIYRTTDGGVTWTQFATANGLPTLQLTDVAFAPNNPTLIYAATNAQGAFRSTNNGATWTRVGQAVAGGRLVVSSNGTLYNVLPTAVSRLVDTTWQSIALPIVNNEVVLSFSPISSTTFVLGSSNAVYRSENGGATWTARNQIDKSSIRVSFRAVLESEWQGELIFVFQGDTTRIRPYRNNDVLAQYDAGLVSVPPIDPNPKASQFFFVPNEPLLNGWRYRLLIQGAFRGNVFIGNVGAKDSNGNSMLEDYLSGFVIATQSP